MEKYERRQAVFAGRKSFSKTDAEATFMRMKDDAMGNGQLKAAYNVQAGTENQFIVDTTVHQRPGDTACAIPRCEHVKERIGHLPANFVADAGYGSEENYAYLEREGADAYVKHNEFFRECRNEKWLDDEMMVANWAHDENSDKHACPEGRTLAFCGESRGCLIWATRARCGHTSARTARAAPAGQGARSRQTRIPRSGSR